MKDAQQDVDPVLRLRLESRCSSDNAELWQQTVFLWSSLNAFNSQKLKNFNYILGIVLQKHTHVSLFTGKSVEFII